MVDRVRPAVPWFLVAASALCAALALYILLAGFLPAKQRAVRLEQELKALYAQEAQLHSTLAQVEQRLLQRDRQIEQLRGERDALARRVEELERSRPPPRSP